MNRSLNSSSNQFITNYYFVIIGLFFETLSAVRPVIEPFAFKEEGVNEGSNVKIFCSVVNGDQPIKIQWAKNRKILSRKTQIIDDSTILLSLQRVTLEDAGNYTCSARNSAGVARHSSQLKIKGCSANYVPIILIPISFQHLHLLAFLDVLLDVFHVMFICVCYNVTTGPPTHLDIFEI